MQFWYFYPSDSTVQIEFETKWQTLLPTGKFRHDKVIDGITNPYAWKPIRMQGKIAGIKFINTNVAVYFRTYSQKVTNLQASTVHAMFCDEEVPVDYYDELMFRLTATAGHFNTVFTATIGQEFWRLAMEPEPHETENLKQADKWTVSLYDCMEFMDGKKSHWTIARIEEVIAKCSTHDEVLRRVHGKFIRDSKGLKYPQFNLKKNFGPPEPKPIPSDWLIYVGVDTGSGGKGKGKSKKGGHPSAVCFIAVRPDFKFARVYKAWRGDGIPTTSADVVNKYLEMSAGRSVTRKWYDFANADFKMVAERMGHPFESANKSHDKGEYVLNILFKHGMIELDSQDSEIYKLAVELSSVRRDIDKNQQLDDLSDAFRYGIVEIPWDFSDLPIDLAAIMNEASQARPETPEERLKRDMQMKLEWRRNGFPPDEPGRINEDQNYIEAEFEEFNEYADPYH
jgi:phage terminase large subunit-like protein